MDINQALQKLFSLHQFGIKLGLENIRKLLDYLGNPQDKLHTFHIAGSNGKGSTSSFMASILMEYGYNTALYTSPHFVRYNERIRINSKMIEDEYVKDFINDLNAYIDDNSPTFFELTTALAFKYFAENNVDYAVIETGLGGRLDATNTINPIASVITTISKEHTNVLTDSISNIAYEKGEIIKKGGKSFAGLLPDEAMEVIRKKAKSVSSDFYELGKILEKKSEFVKLNLSEFHYSIYNTPLSGYHQLINSSLAVLALKNSLGINNVDHFNDGIRRVLTNTGIQGRYEKYNGKPDIIFDSAHNEEGVGVFIKEFERTKNNYEKRTLIFGVMKDKNIKDMLASLSKHFDEILLTSINYERASSVDELKKLADELKIETNVLDNPVEYIKKFKEEGKENCLVVLGSMYLLGKIKEEL